MPVSTGAEAVEEVYSKVPYLVFLLLTNFTINLR